MSSALLDALAEAPDKGADADSNLASLAEARAEQELVAALESKDAKRIRKAMRVLRDLDDDE